jgi:hypothetical protein
MAVLEVNTGKTKWMLMSQHWNDGRDHNVKTANKTFENVAQFNISERQ